ncbi:hypothetical protein F5878DRAFT_423789 [Lentinula raphanica]|uniref:Uncharacterized protein n=1 Tax=Lentinula raphanica TaxID=153919 RepID=A0AA38UIC1_9AGAR|nr:hypothetical protein F5878DRAFT_423789 [Lentinula raphanica]
MNPIVDSIEMQCIPKHGPNHVYKTREQAERARKASQKIKMPPMTYVPLRPQRKFFLHPGEEEAHIAEVRRDIALLKLRLRNLRLCRGTLILFIALNNAVVAFLLVISLALGSGTVWEALFQIPNWLSLILIAFYLIHRFDHRMFEAIRIRNYVVFSALAVSALCNGFLFTSRIQNGVMCRDLSSIEPHSCRASQFLVAISFVTAALATVGNIVNWGFTKIGQPNEQVPTPLHDPFTDFNISSKTWNPKFTLFYEDMPPPRKVQPTELLDGWVDVPLYVDHHDQRR